MNIVCVSDGETLRTGERAVSVLMPVYNRESQVGDAIRSIQNQTFRDWELIILDDGSTDRTLQVCRSYEAEDSRIRVFANETNLGVGISRNRLLGYASGKYIAIQDSDDISLPERLEREVQWLDSNPEVGLVTGVAAMMDFDTGQTFWHNPPYLYKGEQYPQDKNAMVRLLYFSCDIPNTACMFRRSLIERMPEPYGKYAVNEDWNFFIALAHQTLIQGIPEVLVRMNRSKNHTHIMSRYTWWLQEAKRFKRDLYERYKSDPNSPIDYLLFRKSIALLLLWEGQSTPGWRGCLTTARALLWNPFFADAWKSLLRRGLRKAKRMVQGQTRKMPVLPTTGD